MHVCSRPSVELPGFFFWRCYWIGGVGRGSGDRRGSRCTDASGHDGVCMAAFVCFLPSSKCRWHWDNRTHWLQAFGWHWASLRGGWAVSVLATLGAASSLYLRHGGPFDGLRWRAVAALGSGALLVAATPCTSRSTVRGQFAVDCCISANGEPHWLHDHTLATGPFSWIFSSPPDVDHVGWRDGPRLPRYSNGLETMRCLSRCWHALAADSTGVGAYYATMAIPDGGLIDVAFGGGRIALSWLTSAGLFGVGRCRGRPDPAQR